MNNDEKELEAMFASIPDTRARSQELSPRDKAELKAVMDNIAYLELEIDKYTQVLNAQKNKAKSIGKKSNIYGSDTNHTGGAQGVRYTTKE